MQYVMLNRNRTRRKQHSSGMLPPTLVATTRYQYWWRGGGLGPQVNKFEKISSDDHQMSVTG